MNSSGMRVKPTDFAYYLTTFLSKYLPGTLGLSPNTIMSYRDSFHLLLAFYCEQKGRSADKLTLGELNKQLIEDYLEWLEKRRHCKTSTRNVRLAAIHAFCRYLQMEFPDDIYSAQQILAIPIKKTKSPLLSI